MTLRLVLDRLEARAALVLAQNVCDARNDPPGLERERSIERLALVAVRLLSDRRMSIEGVEHAAREFLLRYDVPTVRDGTRLYVLLDVLLDVLRERSVPGGRPEEEPRRGGRRRTVDEIAARLRRVR